MAFRNLPLPQIEALITRTSTIHLGRREARDTSEVSELGHVAAVENKGAPKHERSGVRAKP